MELLSIIIGIITCIGVFIAIICLINGSKKRSVSEDDLRKIKESTTESIQILSKSISDLVAEKNNAIMANVSKSNEEINFKMQNLILSQEKTIKDLESNMKKLEEEHHKASEKEAEAFNKFNLDFVLKYNKQKEDIMDKLSMEIKNFNDSVKLSLEESNKSLKEKLDEFKKTTSDSIKTLNETVSLNLKEIREDNNRKLEDINKSVNEKLQKTLEDKLKDSFESVVKSIGSVQESMGEIKNLASDVGSLKNVLTNVKTKGNMGEVILGNIIRDFLPPTQFEENVVTKKSSSERVEFAIKLPGQAEESILLPVDSKFPYEPYSIIQESSNLDEIKKARQTLRTNLLKYAADVAKKYIDVPNTTDFAIIFLPLEGLYLEALNMGVFEEIQMKYKVNLTGPTTFSAFINSLSIGFRTLAIQKKSADVFKLLGAVKAEFNKFADVLAKTQKKMSDASDELDKLVGTRTRLIVSKLKGIEALDDETSKLMIDGEDENIE